MLDVEQTFQQAICAERGWPEADFAGRIFWHCLHRHAWPFAPVLILFHSEYFRADLELIALVGRVRTWRDFNEEVRDFVLDHRNRNWWRRRALLRISTHRLRTLARPYLGPGWSGRVVAEG